MFESSDILNFFKSNKKTISIKEIETTLQLTDKEMKLMKNQLKEMVKEGKLIRHKKGLYGPARKEVLVTGHFEFHKEGHGFVITDNIEHGPVRIHQRRTFGALDGDMVTVSVSTGKRGVRRGRVIRIEERACKHITGTLLHSKKMYYVKPLNLSLSPDIVVERIDRSSMEEGDIVVVEIKEQPDKTSPLSGEIIKKVLPPDNPKSDITFIIEEYGLSRKFSAKVKEEIEKIPAKIPPDMMKSRIDMRQTNTMTIDGEKAKDFDDAVSLKATAAGYRLYVHIADVSFFVPWNSETDKEARQRGTSVYFHDRVVPMLPPKLSEGLCSLKPKVERLTLTAEMDFNTVGEMTGALFYPSVISSKARLTYTVVKKILEDKDAALRKRYSSLVDDLELMKKLALLLRKKRLQRGSLDLCLPDTEIISDNKGNPVNIIKSESNIGHRMIEEFMIAANEAVADRIEKIGMPGIFRIHEKPEKSKIEEVSKVLMSVLKTKKKRIVTSNIHKILKSSISTPYEETVSSFILRSLKQAKYSPDNIGHFGLASDCYVHFTSPIRRYPDLVVHRILKELIGKKSIPGGKKTEFKSLLSEISVISSKRERNADEAERESVKALKAWFMKGMIGKTFKGRVTDISERGLRVRLEEHFVDGLLRMSDLKDDYYVFDKKTFSLGGRKKKKRFFIADEITVRVREVDIGNREIFLAPVR